MKKKLEQILGVTAIVGVTALTPACGIKIEAYPLIHVDRVPRNSWNQTYHQAKTPQEPLGAPQRRQYQQPTQQVAASQPPVVQAPPQPAKQKPSEKELYYHTDFLTGKVVNWVQSANISVYNKQGQTINRTINFAVIEADDGKRYRLAFDPQTQKLTDPENEKIWQFVKTNNGRMPVSNLAKFLGYEGSPDDSFVEMYGLVKGEIQNPVEKKRFYQFWK